MPDASDDTDDLFAEVDGQGEGESTLAPPVTDMANQPVPESTALVITKVAIQPVADQQGCFSQVIIYMFFYIFVAHFFVFGEQYLSVMDNA